MMVNFGIKVDLKSYAVSSLGNATAGGGRRIALCQRWEGKRAGTDGGGGERKLREFEI
jgi:hypothetical protein